MKKAIDVILIGGFLVTDFIMFHDLFKPGEIYTSVERAIGILSILVIIRAVWALFSDSR